MTQAQWSVSGVEFLAVVRNNLKFTCSEVELITVVVGNGAVFKHKVYKYFNPREVSLSPLALVCCNRCGLIV